LNVLVQTGTTPPLNVLVHKVVEVVVSVKVTVPVGTADPVNAGVTVAVKDTCWFVVDGAGDDTTPVVVLAAETTSAPLVAAARPEKFESPL